MKFNPAYSKGRPYYRHGKPTPGVYIIKHRGRIQYVGYSYSNVVKTAYRHFQKWEDRQYRATFPRSAEMLIFKTTRKQAERLEKYYIEKYQPERNTYIPSVPLIDYYNDPIEVPF